MVRAEASPDRDELPVLDGRRVYSRRDLTDRYRLSGKKLEALYRDRETTGHPEAAGTLGQALAWDAEVWDTWYADYASTDGLLGFDQIAHRYGISPATETAWWGDRETNGHPAPVKKLGNTLYFDAADYDQWYEGTKARPVVGYRPVDPDELVTLTEGARLAGLDPSSVAKYKRRPPAGCPQPVPGAGQPLPSGRTREMYRAGDWITYGRTRGRHGGGRPPGPRTERRYPYDGDPRLDLARTALADTPPEQHPDLPTRLAQAHGGSPGTWANILTTARQHPTDQ
ncbi:MAG TPA: hypothetical protein VI248_18315 [Kineosporiaceae bacterium]